MPQTVCYELQHLQRFLCLGKNSSVYKCQTDISALTYTINEVEIIKAVLRLEDGCTLAIETICSFSRDCRAAIRLPTLFALAVCARCDNQVTKTQAFDALLEICTIPTDLFVFLSQYIKLQTLDGRGGKGWGRAIRRALSRWYHDNSTGLQLAHHVTKYPQRHHWHHREVLKLAHVKPPRQPDCAYVLEYIRHGRRRADNMFRRQMDSVKDVAEFLKAVEDCKSRTLDENQLVLLINKHHLCREHILTEWLSSPGIWKALLPHMPVMAVIRNLGKMASLDILQRNSREAKLVIEKLHSINQLVRSRLHPFYLLHALRTYGNGHGVKGDLHWEPNKDIVKELELAFYQSFANTEPTGKRLLLAVDVATSDNECQIDPSTAAAVLAMYFARTEREFEIVYFAEEIRALSINATMNLADIMNLMPTDSSHTSCNCNMPIQWALDENKYFDVFIIFTSCSTLTQGTEAVHTLSNYRICKGTNTTKLVIVTMTTNDHLIGDVNDNLILNVVGFDRNGLEVINDFIRRVQ